MITQEEKVIALYSLSFNRYKALKLFSFCLASFCIGLSALYWSLDYQYEQKLDTLKDNLFKQMDIQEGHHALHPVTSLYEGVLEYQGVFDSDNALPLQEVTTIKNKGKLIKVKGQRRLIAQGVYQLRFVPVSSSNKKPQAKK